MLAARLAQRWAGRRTLATRAGKRPVMVTILDGWGYRETRSNNAVQLADTPAFDGLVGKHSQLGQMAFLDACERARATMNCRTSTVLKT